MTQQYVQALERLAFELVPGEQRFFVQTPQATLCCAVRRAEVGDQRPQKAIVFVHGAASNASRWEDFVEKTALARSWTLLRFDLRGHGASEGLRPATLERHADDIAAILDAAGVDTCFLVGHSLGAQVVLQFCARHPLRTEGVVLIDPLIGSALTDLSKDYEKRRWVLSALEMLGRLANGIGIRRRLDRYSLRASDEAARAKLTEGGAALEAFVKAYSSPWADLKHMHLADYTRDLLEVSRHLDETPERLSQCPVLVFASKAGAYTESDKLRTWTASFGGDFSVLDCVHWPLTECPEAIESQLLEWFAIIGSRQGGALS